MLGGHLILLITNGFGLLDYFFNREQLLGSSTLTKIKIREATIGSGYFKILKELVVFLFFQIFRTVINVRAVGFFFVLFWGELWF